MVECAKWVFWNSLGKGIGVSLFAFQLSLGWEKHFVV